MRPASRTPKVRLPVLVCRRAIPCFFADGKLKKLNLSGGPVQTFCDAPTGRGGTWGKDGVILFTPSGHLGVGLYRISASGGIRLKSPLRTRVWTEDSHRWPVFLPDRYALPIFRDSSFRPERPQFGLFGITGFERETAVTKSSANVAYVAPYLLFYRDQTLLGQRFDTKHFSWPVKPHRFLPTFNTLREFRERHSLLRPPDSWWPRKPEIRELRNFCGLTDKVRKLEPR